MTEELVSHRESSYISRKDSGSRNDLKLGVPALIPYDPGRVLVEQLTEHSARIISSGSQSGRPLVDINLRFVLKLTGPSLKVSRNCKKSRVVIPA